MWTVAFLTKDSIKPVLDLKLAMEDALALRKQWQEMTGRAVFALPHAKAAAIYRAQHLAKAEHPWVVYAVDLRTRKITKLSDQVPPLWFKIWRDQFFKTPKLPETLRLIFLPS